MNPCTTSTPTSNNAMLKGANNMRFQKPSPEMLNPIPEKKNPAADVASVGKLERSLLACNWLLPKSPSTTKMKM